MTDLAHWLDQHRAYLAKLVYHLVYSLHVLPDHDQHALQGVLAEAAAVSKAAGEVERHLEHSDLVGTELYAQYRMLAVDIAQGWPQDYRQGGAEAVRTQAIPMLEDAMRRLEHPTIAVHHDNDPEQGKAEWEWLLATTHTLQTLLHQLRDELTMLRHDAAHVSATHDLLTAVTDTLTASTQHLAHLDDLRRRARFGENWLEDAGQMYHLLLDHVSRPPLFGSLADGVAADSATLHALEEFSWMATEGLNVLLRR